MMVAKHNRQVAAKQMRVERSERKAVASDDALAPKARNARRCQGAEECWQTT